MARVSLVGWDQNLYSFKFSAWGGLVTVLISDITLMKILAGVIIMIMIKVPGKNRGRMPYKGLRYLD